MTGQSVINPNTEMESVWSGASGGRITLWCNTKNVVSADLLLCIAGLTKYCYSG